jgi:hypothetical protein
VGQPFVSGCDPILVRMVRSLSIDVSTLDSGCNLPLDIPFTAAMARAEGVPRHLLTQWCRMGLLRQPIGRVYVSSALPDTTALRVACLVLVVPDDCVVCDRHAGWLHGAEMALAPNEHLQAMPISLFRPSGNGRLENRLSVSGERNLRSDDITEVLGIPVTTKVRTAWDLGRVRRRESAISGMDQMLRLQGFPHDEFLAGVERFRGMRWVTTLRTLAPLADGRAESPPESVLRLYWIDCGLPHPVPQLEVWRDGVLIARLDIGNPDLRYAAEYDGEEWHSSPGQRDHDRLRRQAVAEQDFVVDVFTRANVFGQHRNAEELLVRGAARAHALRRTRAFL